MVTSSAVLPILADGWAGKYNPLTHPRPQTQTLAGAEIYLHFLTRLFTLFDSIITD